MVLRLRLPTGRGGLLETVVDPVGPAGGPGGGLGPAGPTGGPGGGLGGNVSNQGG